MRAQQSLLDRKAARGGFGQFRREQGKLAPAQLLRAEQRRIGGPQQSFRVASVFRKNARTDARADADFPAIDGHRFLKRVNEVPARGLDGCNRAGALVHESELVAPQAGHDPRPSAISSSRLATLMRTRSPNTCPWLSLKFLKLSMSGFRTPRQRFCQLAASIAAFSSVDRCRRFGSDVRGSCCASCCSLWVRCRTVSSRLSCWLRLKRWAWPVSPPCR